jgi:HK97 gp10 family phage protein
MAQPAFKFELHGVKETMAALEQLPTLSMKKTVVRNALKKAAIPIRDAAKIKAGSIKYDADNIVKSIHVDTKLTRKQRRDRSRVTVYVGPSHPLAHLFEFGTGRRFTKKKNAYRGYITATPFLRQAWDEKKMVALDVLKKELWEQIKKSARRLAKRAEAGKLTKTQIAGLSK